MDLHLRAFWRSTEWTNRFYRSNVLLTGATGFLGSHLLARLLLSSQVFLEIYLANRYPKFRLMWYVLFAKAHQEQ